MNDIGGTSVNNHAHEGGFLSATQCGITIIGHEAINNMAIASEISATPTGGYGGWMAVHNLRSQSTVSRTVMRGNTAIIGGAAALVDAPITFVDCVFENNEASGMAAVLYVDTKVLPDRGQPEWPLIWNNNNKFLNNESPFGSNHDGYMMVTRPFTLLLVSNTCVIEQTSDAIVSPGLEMQLVDYFGQNMTISPEWSNDFFGDALLSATTTASVPTGIIQVPMTNDGNNDGIGRYRWSSVRMLSHPGGRYTYVAQMERLIALPFGDFLADPLVMISYRVVAIKFQLSMRQCRPGEYVTKTSCQPCAPVHLIPSSLITTVRVNASVNE
jgi:hypothetical protein